MTGKRQDTATERQQGKKRMRPPADVERAVRDAVLQGYTPVSIHRWLKQHGRAPSLRTVQRIAAEVRKKGERWRLLDASLEEVALIVPAIRELAERSEGRVTSLTREQAEAVARIRRAAPIDPGPWLALRIADAYQRREGKDKAEDLDLLVAFAPWRDQEAGARFLAWVGRCRPGWLEWVDAAEFEARAAGEVPAEIARVHFGGDTASLVGQDGAERKMVLAAMVEGMVLALDPHGAWTRPHADNGEGEPQAGEEVPNGG